jgi:hypothetical protein
MSYFNMTFYGLPVLTGESHEKTKFKNIRQSRNIDPSTMAFCDLT